MNAPPSSPWKFCLGIHRGTITSRDAEIPKQLPSLEACYSEAQAALKAYSSIGVKIWYCYATDGKQQVELLTPQPYER